MYIRMRQDHGSFLRKGHVYSATPVGKDEIIITFTQGLRVKSKAIAFDVCEYDVILVKGVWVVVNGNTYTRQQAARRARFLNK